MSITSYVGDLFRLGVALFNFVTIVEGDGQVCLVIGKVLSCG